MSEQDSKGETNLPPDNQAQQQDRPQTDQENDIQDTILATDMSNIVTLQVDL